MQTLRSLTDIVRLRAGGRLSEAALWLSALDRREPATCPICAHSGLFAPAGFPPRLAVRCPSCRSLERHRLFALAHKAGFIDFRGVRVLHFAPEASIMRMVRADGPARHDDADIEPGRASLVLDLMKLDVADDAYDRIVCSHVLEHVPSVATALAEMRRVLTPGGFAIVMIPIVEGWDQTYESDGETTEAVRLREFGQGDHVRYFGRDFRRKVTDAGFRLEEFTAWGPDCAAHALERGEKVFKAVKDG